MDLVKVVEVSCFHAIVEIHSNGKIHQSDVHLVYHLEIGAMVHYDRLQLMGCNLGVALLEMDKFQVVQVGTTLWMKVIGVAYSKARFVN